MGRRIVLSVEVILELDVEGGQKEVKEFLLDVQKLPRVVEIMLVECSSIQGNNGGTA